MNKFLLYTFLFVLGANLINCSTTRYYHELEPVESYQNQSRENDELGIETVELEKPESAFKCAFLQGTQYDLIFEVTITNHDTEDLFMSPEDFSFMALDEREYPIAELNAFEPEALLFDIESSLEEDKKALKRNKALGWIFLGLDVALTATSIANERPEALGQAINTGLNLAAFQIETGGMKKHIVYLEGERDYYENATLRTTTLLPGESVTGIVIFPRVDEANQLAFKYPIGRNVYEITYNQRWIKATR